MFIADHARARPDHPALIDTATGAALSYRDLDERSSRFAQFLFARGLRRGDAFALFMENNPRFLEIVWAGRRSGLYVTAINRYLTPEEAAYIVNDSDSQLLVTSLVRSDVASQLPGLAPDCRDWLMTDG